MKTLDWSVIGISGIAILAFVVLRAMQKPSGQDGTTSKARASGLAQTGPAYSASGHDLTPISEERIAELAKDLTPEERHILREEGTERPFTGALLKNKESGVYACRLCGLPLYKSDAKFDSGCGWPSFYEAVEADHITLKPDHSLGMVRTELECKRCGSHLGHVFDDGPKPTGKRHCLNSASLRFHKEGAPLPPGSQPMKTETAYFAGGCFWGIEDRFQQVPGVIDAVSGYQGGHTDKPTYKQVCGGRTGHAETVRVTFDPEKVSYRQLLDWFFKFHDAAQLNRQGPDIGTQYRSAIFTANDQQQREATAFIAELQATERYRDRKIVTQIAKAGPFFEAEEYHQDYHAKHGGSCPLPPQ